MRRGFRALLGVLAPPDPADQDDELAARQDDANVLAHDTDTSGSSYSLVVPVGESTGQGEVPAQSNPAHAGNGLRGAEGGNRLAEVAPTGVGVAAEASEGVAKEARVGDLLAPPITPKKPSDRENPDDAAAHAAAAALANQRQVEVGSGVVTAVVAGVLPLENGAAPQQPEQGPGRGVELSTPTSPREPEPIPPPPTPTASRYALRSRCVGAESAPSQNDPRAAVSRRRRKAPTGRNAKDGVGEESRLIQDDGTFADEACGADHSHVVKHMAIDESVKNMEEASTQTLRAFCLEKGLKTDGGKERLRRRVANAMLLESENSRSILDRSDPMEPGVKDNVAVGAVAPSKGEDPSIPVGLEEKEEGEREGAKTLAATKDRNTRRVGKKSRYLNEVVQPARLHASQASASTNSGEDREPARNSKVTPGRSPGENKAPPRISPPGIGRPGKADGPTHAATGADGGTGPANESGGELAKNGADDGVPASDSAQPVVFADTPRGITHQSTPVGQSAVANASQAADETPRRSKRIPEPRFLDATAPSVATGLDTQGIHTPLHIGVQPSASGAHPPFGGLPSQSSRDRHLRSLSRPNIAHPTESVDAQFAYSSLQGDPAAVQDHMPPMAMNVAALQGAGVDGIGPGHMADNGSAPGGAGVLCGPVEGIVRDGVAVRGSSPLLGPSADHQLQAAAERPTDHPQISAKPSNLAPGVSGNLIRSASVAAVAGTPRTYDNSLVQVEEGVRREILPADRIRQTPLLDPVAGKLVEKEHPATMPPSDGRIDDEPVVPALQHPPPPPTPSDPTVANIINESAQGRHLRNNLMASLSNIGKRPFSAVDGIHGQSDRTGSLAGNPIPPLSKPDQSSVLAVETDQRAEVVPPHRHQRAASVTDRDTDRLEVRPDERPSQPNQNALSTELAQHKMPPRDEAGPALAVKWEQNHPQLAFHRHPEQPNRSQPHQLPGGSLSLDRDAASERKQPASPKFRPPPDKKRRISVPVGGGHVQQLNTEGNSGVAALTSVGRPSNLGPFGGILSSAGGKSASVGDDTGGQGVALGAECEGEAEKGVVTPAFVGQITSGKTSRDRAPSGLPPRPPAPSAPGIFLTSPGALRRNSVIRANSSSAAVGGMNLSGIPGSVPVPATSPAPSPSPPEEQEQVRVGSAKPNREVMSESVRVHRPLAVKAPAYPPGAVTPQDVIRTLQNTTTFAADAQIATGDTVQPLPGSAFGAPSPGFRHRSVLQRQDSRRSLRGNRYSNFGEKSLRRSQLPSSSGGLVTNLRAPVERGSAAAAAPLRSDGILGNPGRAVAVSASAKKILASLDKVSRENQAISSKRTRSPLGMPPSSKRRRRGENTQVESPGVANDVIGGTDWFLNTIKAHASTAAAKVAVPEHKPKSLTSSRRRDLSLDGSYGIAPPQKNSPWGPSAQVAKSSRGDGSRDEYIWKENGQKSSGKNPHFDLTPEKSSGTDFPRATIRKRRPHISSGKAAAAAKLFASNIGHADAGAESAETGPFKFEVPPVGSSAPANTFGTSRLEDQNASFGDSKTVPALPLFGKNAGVNPALGSVQADPPERTTRPSEAAPALPSESGVQISMKTSADESLSAATRPAVFPATPSSWVVPSGSSRAQGTARSKGVADQHMGSKPTGQKGSWQNAVGVTPANPVGSSFEEPQSVAKDPLLSNTSTLPAGKNVFPAVNGFSPMAKEPSAVDEPLSVVTDPLPHTTEPLSQATGPQFAQATDPSVEHGKGKSREHNDTKPASQEGGLGAGHNLSEKQERNFLSGSSKPAATTEAGRSLVAEPTNSNVQRNPAAFVGFEVGKNLSGAQSGKKKPLPDFSAFGKLGAQTQNLEAKPVSSLLSQKYNPVAGGNSPSPLSPNPAPVPSAHDIAKTEIPSVSLSVAGARSPPQPDAAVDAESSDGRKAAIPVSAQDPPASLGTGSFAPSKRAPSERLPVPEPALCKPDSLPTNTALSQKAEIGVPEPCGGLVAGVGTKTVAQPLASLRAQTPPTTSHSVAEAPIPGTDSSTVPLANPLNAKKRVGPSSPLASFSDKEVIPASFEAGERKVIAKGSENDKRPVAAKFEFRSTPTESPGGPSVLKPSVSLSGTPGPMATAQSSAIANAASPFGAPATSGPVFGTSTASFSQAGQAGFPVFASSGNPPFGSIPGGSSDAGGPLASGLEENPGAQPGSDKKSSPFSFGGEDQTPSTSKFGVFPASGLASMSQSGMRDQISPAHGALTSAPTLGTGLTPASVPLVPQSAFGVSGGASEKPPGGASSIGSTTSPSLFGTNSSSLPSFGFGSKPFAASSAAPAFGGGPGPYFGSDAAPVSGGSGAPNPFGAVGANPFPGARAPPTIGPGSGGVFTFGAPVPPATSTPAMGAMSSSVLPGTQAFPAQGAFGSFGGAASSQGVPEAAMTFPKLPPFGAPAPNLGAPAQNLGTSAPNLGAPAPNLGASGGIGAGDKSGGFAIGASNATGPRPVPGTRRRLRGRRFQGPTR